MLPNRPFCFPQTLLGPGETVKILKLRALLLINLLASIESLQIECLAISTNKLWNSLWICALQSSGMTLCWRVLKEETFLHRAMAALLVDNEGSFGASWGLGGCQVPPGAPEMGYKSDHFANFITCGICSWNCPHFSVMLLLRQTLVTNFCHLLLDSANHCFLSWVLTQCGVNVEKEQFKVSWMQKSVYMRKCSTGHKESYLPATWCSAICLSTKSQNPT